MRLPYVAPVTDKIPFEAQKLAVKMLTVASKANYTGCYALGASDVASLRAAILAHPIYHFIKWNSKGSYGDNGLALS